MNCLDNGAGVGGNGSAGSGLADGDVVAVCVRGERGDIRTMH